MTSSPEPVTVGYWYYMSAHLAIAHTVDKFLKIRVGDKIAWTGAVTANSTVNINKPELFGGEDREGGFIGDVDFIMGSATESANSYLQSVLPSASPMPAFRGVSCLVLKDVAVSANNPNLRPLNVEVFRQPSPGWYTAKDTPGTAGGVNPAHIIRECLTNVTWGMGYSANDLDDVKFRAAADQLYTEGFGLSFAWQSSGTLQDFISEVISHIQGSLYIDPFTGLFVLKLVRADYVVANLPTLDESNIIAVDSFERTGSGELVSQVTVVWYESSTDKKRAVTVHNTGVREIQGGPVSATMELPGIPDAALAQKVASRELRRLSTSVSKVVLRANRDAAGLLIGDVFKLTWSDYGISSVVMRVGKVEHGTLGSAEVRLHCVEDIFAFGDSLYAPAPASLWEDPIHPPAACPYHQAKELTYLSVRQAAQGLQSTINDLDVMAGFLAYQGTLPSDDAFSYKLLTRTGTGAYTYRTTGRFCPTALVTNAMVPEVTSTLALTGMQAFSQIRANSYAYIENECVAVVSVTSSSVTVNRGILDTFPVAHPAGSRIWFAEGNEAWDSTQWASGVTVNAKALTTTGAGTLLEASAPADNLVINRRWYRPYPPGNLTVNGSRWPIAIQVGDLVLNWSHRDRLTQISYYVKQDEGNFGPEAGVTYTIRVYRNDNSLARTVTGLSVLTWTYTAAFATADAPGATVRFDLVSDRAALESWLPATVTINR